MLFNSYIFILVFLPIALILWYSMNKLGRYELAKFFLCLMSLWFYGYFHVNYLYILIGSLIINYGFSYIFKKLEKSNDENKSRILKRLTMILGVSINIAILGYFKYYDFFISNVNSILGSNYTLKHIMLPLGISFFTFQQISFVVDRYKGDAPHYKLLDYASFVTFFPQLIAGPIVLHSELVPQFEDKTKKSFSSEDFSDGLCIFVVGLAWKVLLADNLGLVVDYSFANIDSLDSPSALLGTLTYTLEMFFDFAGYSNMAIGIGKMFRIDLPDNFNRPFHCTNNKDTWRYWHITLGRFFRTYVYFPLGGSRKGFGRALLNNMIVFALSGLWHGAGFTYIVWGVMHGTLICINMIWQKWMKSLKKVPAFFASKIWKNICIICNFGFFCLSMVVFRANNMAEAMLYFKRMFSGINYYFVRMTAMEIPFTELYPVLKVLNMKLGNNVCYVYIVLYLLLLAFCIVISQIRSYKDRLQTIKEKMMNNARLQTVYSVWIGLLFVWCLISLSGVSQFLYFNF